MKNIIEEIKEFLMVSAQYCLFLENCHEYSSKEFISNMQKLLTLIYLKTTLLPFIEDVDTNEVEKFVQESDWEYIRNKVVTKLGHHESYVDIYTPETFNTSEVDNASLSECLTDIYQDLKDISTLIQIATDDVIKSGLIELKYNFESFWGPRLISVLSVLHNLVYSNLLEEENSVDQNTLNKDTFDF